MTNPDDVPSAKSRSIPRSVNPDEPSSTRDNAPTFELTEVQYVVWEDDDGQRWRRTFEDGEVVDRPAPRQ